MGLFFSLLKKQKKRKKVYNVFNLIDQQWCEPFPDGDKDVQCICDIDKTYLETHFDTMFQMAKIAFWERPDHKITVPGATEILQAFRWGDRRTKESFPRPLHFVSSSPPQLRHILRQKFQMDGLDWTSDTFKNQSYNIKKGRFDLFRHQTAYKTAAISQLLKGYSYILIGDSAEADPFIYLGLYLYLKKRLSEKGYQTYLSFVGVEPHISQRILPMLPHIQSSRIQSIWIRNLVSKPWAPLRPLTDPIACFDSYHDLAVFFGSQGYLSNHHVASLSWFFHKVHNLSVEAIGRTIGWFAQKGLLKDEMRDTLKDWPLHLGEKKDWHWDQLDEFRKLRESDILDLTRVWAKNLHLKEEGLHGKNKSNEN